MTEHKYDHLKEIMQHPDVNITIIEEVKTEYLSNDEFKKLLQHWEALNYISYKQANYTMLNRKELNTIIDTNMFI